MAYNPPSAAIIIFSTTSYPDDHSKDVFLEEVHKYLFVSGNFGCLGKETPQITFEILFQATVSKAQTFLISQLFPLGTMTLIQTTHVLFPYHVTSKPPFSATRINISVLRLPANSTPDRCLDHILCHIKQPWPCNDTFPQTS